AMQFGTDGNVGARLSLDDYRRLFPWYPEIEAYWGHAPGELLTDGKDFYILGADFGEVFVAIQPSFGYERDPMRLLMGKDASPHHGFAAFYTWLDHVYDADAVIHLGTHGALEFMPGKQVGLGADCWPPRLLGALPNFYYYCVNNPSEGSIAKRRGAATLVSYMVPPLHQAGLYKGLRRLKDDLDTYHKRHDAQLLTDIRAQADRLGIVVSENGQNAVNAAENYVAALGHELLQVEHRMIPLGLHVIGTPPAEDELADLLALTAAFNPAQHPNGHAMLPVLPALIAKGLGADFASLQADLKTSTEAQALWDQIEHIAGEAMRHFIRAPRTPELDTSAADAYLYETANISPGLLVNLWAWLDALVDRLTHDQELHGMLHSLAGGYIPPSPGNDVMRNEHIVPTGRNIHALDPYRIPSSVAVGAAEEIVAKMLERLTAENGTLPETVAMVLWGTDNLKSDGEGIAQCLHLLGARPVADELGNISDVELIPLAELGRPRIDIVMTLSGIFRDLFHHQAGLLDKAVRLAAHADEPLEQNFVRAHTLEHAATLGIAFDEAAARVYSNAPGAYGAHVNHLVDSSTWDSDDQLSEAFLARKSFAFTPAGDWQAARGVMERSLATVEAAFQNIDSFELGISDVDHYYEYLGGVAKSVEKLGGKRPSVMVADAIALDDRLSSLEGMVRLETRAKLLNPKWHESMLHHGYEGVHEIEIRVSNTYGWSATADAVEGWVYDDIATTFMLDEAMRQRMAEANPHATAAIAGRLLEAQARGFWDADDAMLDQLREIYGDLEDQMEGVAQGV
ncbi:MAG: magnesium chelatase subunit H, partial [Anaerolineales bacterium]